MKKQAGETQQANRDTRVVSKTRRAYLLTLCDPTAPEAERFVLLQASHSNQVQRFPDLASAFAFLETQDGRPKERLEEEP